MTSVTSMATHDEGSGATYRLAPSDLTFLLSGCPRCFYLKVRRGIRQPSIPIPRVFTKLDGAQKRYFTGTRTEELHPALPPGWVHDGDNYAVSEPLSVPGHDSRVILRGRSDTWLRFDDGTWGLVDFKTGMASEASQANYGRQLHAYALAAEHPANGEPFIAPVTLMGLLIFEPKGMVALDGAYAYPAEPTWVEVERDDAAFFRLLADIVELLDAPDPPATATDCAWCAYVENLRHAS